MLFGCVTRFGRGFPKKANRIQLGNLLVSKFSFWFYSLFHLTTRCSNVHQPILKCVVTVTLTLTDISTIGVTSLHEFLQRFEMSCKSSICFDCRSSILQLNGKGLSRDMGGFSQRKPMESSCAICSSISLLSGSFPCSI